MDDSLHYMRVEYDDGFPFVEFTCLHPEPLEGSICPVETVNQMWLPDFLGHTDIDGESERVESGFVKLWLEADTPDWETGMSDADALWERITDPGELAAAELAFSSVSATASP